MGQQDLAAHDRLACQLLEPPAAIVVVGDEAGVLQHLGRDHGRVLGVRGCAGLPARGTTDRGRDRRGTGRSLRGPRGWIGWAGSMSEARGHIPSGLASIRSGPTPDADPLGFRWIPADRPLPVPAPLPEDSPGGSCATAHRGAQGRCTQARPPEAETSGVKAASKCILDLDRSPDRWRRGNGVDGSLADSGRGETASHTESMPSRSRSGQIGPAEPDEFPPKILRGLSSRTSLPSCRARSDGPAPPPDAFLGERLRQDPPVHVELGEDELELVGVGVIAQQLHLRQGLDPAPSGRRR